MAISDEISRLQTAKSSIKMAINLKGVTIPDNVTIDYYDTYINQIETKGQYEIKTITPNALGQVVTPSEGYDALSQVIINGDLNLTPQNIANGVTIFGVTGSLQATPKLQHKSATPNSAGQEVMPDDGFDGLSSVSISGDSNLNSSNIKKGVSIFGVTGEFAGSETGGGSTSDSFNVYVQTTEPEEKNGVWIKSSMSSNGTRFFDYVTQKGEFLEGDKFTYLKTNDNVVGQQIIDGEMYVIGSSASTSYKINLKTQTKQSINVPTIDSSGAYGSAVYDGKIYVFYGQYMTYYAYDPVKNTYTTPKNTELFYSSSKYMGGGGAYIYKGKVFLLKNTSGSYEYLIYDLEKGTGKVKSVSYVDIYRGSGFGYSKYYYFWANKGRLYRFNLVDETIELVKTFSDLTTGYVVTYATANYVYLFRSTTQTSANTTYYRYDLNTDVLETFETLNPYYCYSINGRNTYNFALEQLMFDGLNGLLYFRFSGNSSIIVPLPPTAMQFENSPNELELKKGTVAIVQSLYKQVVEIDSNSGLHIGVDNVYIKGDEEFDADIVCFLGDGEKWYLLKNPSEQTATVTFEGIGSQQVIIGEKVSKPAQNPSKDGYVFDYWELDGEAYNFNSVIVGDITLNAKWISYEEIDYIESTGTQYIDTGIVPNSTTRMVLDVAMSDLTNNNRNGWGSTGGAEAFFCGTTNAKSVFFAAVGADWTNTDFETTIDNERHVFDISNEAIMLDNKSYGTGNIGNTATTGQTLYLFALHTEYANGSIYYQAAKEKIYSCKIYDQGVLVRDYVPIKTENGVYALFDKVNNVVYANAGTGSFTGGNEETPVFLSYIESTGTQYIDTGVKAKSTTNFELIGTFDSSSTERILGARNDTYKYDVYVTSNTFRFFYNETYTDTVTIDNSNEYTLEINNGVQTVDGTTYATDTGTFDTELNLYLFAGNINGTASYFGSNIKVHQLKMYDNGELARNLLPYKDEYGVICMYDTVNNKKYYNAGTGTFTGE